MKTYELRFEEIEGRLEEELEKINNQQEDWQVAEQSVAIIRTHLLQIKQIVLTQGFSAADEEIIFFKQLKPRLYSRLIYFHKLLQINLKKPAVSKKAEIKYLHKQQTRLHHFFKKFGFLYEYCRSGANYLDNRFFIRGNSALLPGVECYGVDTDPSFTTGYDFVVAKMMANDLLRKYIEEKLFTLQSAGQLHDKQVEVKLSWTASKASLIELIYGLQSTGVFNNGKAALNDVALFMEDVFRIKLGNYYRAFQEIRIRKKSRTQFIDEMKERLIQKMDYQDENPHYS